MDTTQGYQWDWTPDVSPTRHGPSDDERNPSTLLLDICQRLSIIETQNTTILGEQDEAKRSRALMHDKQDTLGAGLAVVQEQMKTIAPQVLEHEQWRQQVRGGAYVLVGLGAIAFAAIGFVLKQLWVWAVARWR
jgi:hypothetical protein